MKLKLEVSSSAHKHYPLTLGKEYEVVKEENNGYGVDYTIVDDNGDEDCYGGFWFDIVEEPKLIVTAKAVVNGYRQLNLTPLKDYIVVDNIIIDGELTYLVVDDNGEEETYHHSWFVVVKPKVTLIDPDEDELIFNGIKLEVGDYLDLRKHTVEQLEYLSKFYKFYNACIGSVYDGGSYGYLRFTRDLILLRVCTLNRLHVGREYHFNDLFSEDK
jgi:hypothetical protein